ncbi:hypothetical protein QR680_015550 [Steinernema hermaphroditum]|uniref:Uncharacterized protein n=1 Tax=Steinernema hermaphroditum TaxID=289476 RepID=A0AA39H857_9BILA|nr:hypothetical protein QR680_015550 [Steinernema hermaphroditum]
MAENRYKYVICCCYQCHVTTATIIIAISAFLGGLGNFLTLPMENVEEGRKIALAVANAVVCITTVFAIVGVHQRTPCLLIPFIIMLAIGCVGVCIMLVACVGLILLDPQEEQRLFWFMIAMMFTIALMPNIWFTAVTRQCYKYLKTSKRDFAKFSGMYI